MRERALDLLACPGCGGRLELAVAAHEDEHVMTGTLTCAGCARAFPIREGVPRFVEEPGEVGVEERRTAEAFGYEWTRYAELAARYRQQFLDWLRPVTPEMFQGRTVLEGGCGKGRHTALAAGFGARAVVAMDLSQAVDAAFANTRHLANAHVVQADLNRPPVGRVFDYAFSIGVLHHLPDPERGFRALVGRLVPGGAISAWVYGREGNGWIVHGVSPVREHVTSRLPYGVLDALAGLLTVPLWLGTRLLYRPSRGTRLNATLPYAPYLTYIADFPYREQRSIVFDHLVAPVAFYIRRQDFAAWFERAGLEGVAIEHHNANSWRGFGRVPGSDGAAAATPGAGE
ncbi:MAG: methyltransferase domain-containing protein [Gemmatimonadota bacterium]